MNGEQCIPQVTNQACKKVCASGGIVRTRGWARRPKRRRNVLPSCSDSLAAASVRCRAAGLGPDSSLRRKRKGPEPPLRLLGRNGVPRALWDLLVLLSAPMADWTPAWSTKRQFFAVHVVA
jgi:hypothetical protein